MIIDKLLKMASAWAYTVWASAGSYYSNVIDLSRTKGTQIDHPAYLVVRMGTAAATGTSLKFDLVGSDTAWTADDGTGATNEVVYASSGAIATASLTANTNVYVTQIPRDITKRYIGLKVTSVESSDFTTGTIDAFITHEPPLGAY